MGKISYKSDIQIIPLPGQNSKNLKAKETMPYMSDTSIVPRVQKYLESNIDKTYVDINQMADDLQKRYKEYSKRKRTAFRASVKKAYSIVLQSYGLEDRESSEEDVVSDESEERPDEDRFEENTMNNQMVDLYTRGPAKPKQIDENELIDISSDDSEDESRPLHVTANNSNSNVKKTCASTSQPSGSLLQSYINNKAIRPYESTSPDRPRKRKFEATISPIKTVVKKRKVGPQASFQEPVFTFKDVGGMDKVLEEVCKLLLHIKHPELYLKVGISPPRGFLLHGPPGCGKTLLANAIAGELKVPIIKVAAPELVAGVSGESEERIRELFEKAASAAPCVLFIDEIDAITQNRHNAQKEMERRIVAQLLSCLDELSNIENGDMVLVIGATNRPDSIDPALRRAGRFDREICLGIPDVQARTKILKVLTSKLTLSEDFDFEKIAKFTPGYVGADLLSLTREAAMVAVNRVFSGINEHRRIAQETALQKAIEDRRRREEEAKRRADEEEERRAEKENEDKKSDAEAEIILDDDVPKNGSDEKIDTTDAVVVVDDAEEVIIKDAESTTEPKHEDVPPPPALNGDAVLEPEIIVTEPMPVDPKPMSPLDELRSWLHDSRPIDDGQLKELCIGMDDFGRALKSVQPSAKREGFATVPDTTWEDIGSLRDVREELQMAILAPVRHAEQFEQLGLSVPAGVLLCGPPGCGKTLLAKAIANEAGINFISVKGPELLNMYVGESERAVRVCFERARNSAPCVIFFDELDALCPKRSDSREGGATMRVVNQMLTEMDGLESRKGVFLLAASNRPDIIDTAVLRPGRLDKILYVGLPSREDRVSILRAITKNGTKPALDAEVDLVSIGTSEQTKNYTGADLAALVREASVIALKEFMMAGERVDNLTVHDRHFAQALEKIRPSVSEKDQKHYEKLRRMYSAIPQHAEVEEMEYS